MVIASSSSEPFAAHPANTTSVAATKSNRTDAAISIILIAPLCMVSLLLILKLSTHSEALKLRALHEKTPATI
jgi:hypothetical protein